MTPIENFREITRVATEHHFHVHCMPHGVFIHRGNSTLVLTWEILEDAQASYARAHKFICIPEIPY